MNFGSLRTEQEELFFANARHRELTFDATLRVEHRSKYCAANLWQRISEQPLQPCSRTWATYFVLGKVGSFGEADALANGAGFFAHVFERTRAIERHFFDRFFALVLEPQWVFETETNTHHGVVLEQAIVDRCGEQRTCCC